MAAEKLTKKRLIQIIIMLIIFKREKEPRFCGSLFWKITFIYQSVYIAD